jgi:hypothetical protein
LTGDELNPLTSFAAAIHASLLAKQENDEAKKTQDTCGLGLEKRLASYDPDTQSWKMYGDICLWGEPQSLEKLPPSGMTRNGELFQQPAWEPITGEIESSLWPTPVAHDGKDNASPAAMKRKTPGLGVMAQMWPTPTASDSWTLALKSSQIKEGSRHSVTLPVAAGGQLNPTWVEWLMGFPTGWTDLEA